jgi:predicted MFS family arabinose efflux permease
VSDTYGRRRIGLTGLLIMAVGILGSILAWNYGALLACRLLTGVGAAMIPPNSMAAIADHFSPAQRGRPMSLLFSASFLGPVLAILLVALVGEFGGWRLPFVLVRGLCVVLWGLQWVWWPPQAHPQGNLTVFEPVTWALTAELAGESRATANGMLATSNQLGAMTGASVGGAVLAFGGFAPVGLFCLGAAVVAALVIGAKVRGIGALRAHVAGA